MTKPGKLIGFAKITRDVTERQRSFEALLQSESRYRQLIEAVVDYAIFQLDADGLIATWNPGAQRIKGYTSRKYSANISVHFTPKKIRKAGVPQQALETAARPGNTRQKAGASARTAPSSGRPLSLTQSAMSLESSLALPRLRATLRRDLRRSKSFKPRRNN